MIKLKSKLSVTLSGVHDDQLLSFSNGWLQAFQAFHGYKQINAHGESGFVNAV